VVKAILDLSPTSGARDYYAVPKGAPAAPGVRLTNEMDLADQIEALRQEMFVAAENLEFEKAARLRDQLRNLKGDQGAMQAAEAPRNAHRGGASPRGGTKRSTKPGTMSLKSAAGGRGRGRGRGP
jgi:excinuclease ABC subunit B